MQQNEFKEMELENLRNLISEEVKGQNLEEILVDSLVGQAATDTFIRTLNAVVNTITDLAIEKNLFTKEEFASKFETNLETIEEQYKQIDEGLASKK